MSTSDSDREMYRWRQMTSEQRVAVLDERKRERAPGTARRITTATPVCT